MWRLAPLFIVVALLGRGAAATDICGQYGADDVLRPIPQSLVPAAKRLFGLDRMPDAHIRRSTVFRCADGHTLLCNYGANLPCGKANSDRRLPEAEAWCRGHPEADFVPRFAIPSGNIYSWRCSGGVPKIFSQADEIDARCFVARYWKAVHFTDPQIESGASFSRQSVAGLFTSAVQNASAASPVWPALVGAPVPSGHW